MGYQWSKPWNNEICPAAYEAIHSLLLLTILLLRVLQGWKIVSVK